MKLFNILVLLFILLSCKTKYAENNQIEISNPTYTLEGGKDEVLVEKFDSTVIDASKYDNNNTIYVPGAIFTYEFEHRTVNNEINYFKKTSDESKWAFVDLKNADSTTIKSLKISVVAANANAERFPEFNQTGIKYQLENVLAFSTSGAIENEGNVWIHPPRDDYFKILELNPFPFIKAPYKIGTKWKWRLEIGDHWSDKRWKVWNGNIENTYTYEITDEVILNTRLGKLACFVINSTAHSRIGETQLTAYFNLEHGFVKLKYVNIDGSKTLLELIEHSKKQQVPNALKWLN